MNRILKIGFKYAGAWVYDGTSLKLNLLTHSSDKNVLYAFISNGEIKYIGKTTQRLKDRLSGYRTPGKTQSTNIKNNSYIIKSLTKGVPVDIFVLPDNGLLKYGDFSINLAAGLEDSLIERISPPWNGNQASPVDIVKQDHILNHGSINSPASSIIHHDKQLEIILGKAYYNQGFINIPIEHSALLGNNGEDIEIRLGSNQNAVTGYINRTANSNGTPRLMGGREVKHWFKENYRLHDKILVTINSKNSISII